MFLSVVKHDCLVISSELARYLSQRRLFGDHLGQLKQIIAVGDISENDQGPLSHIMEDGALHVVPHPARALLP